MSSGWVSGRHKKCFLTRRTAQPGEPGGHTLTGHLPGPSTVASAGGVTAFYPPAHLEVRGPAAHRGVSSLSPEGRKQNLDGQGTLLWMELLHGEVRSDQSDAPPGCSGGASGQVAVLLTVTCPSQLPTRFYRSILSGWPQGGNPQAWVLPWTRRARILARTIADHPCDPERGASLQGRGAERARW